MTNKSKEIALRQLYINNFIVYMRRKYPNYYKSRKVKWPVGNMIKEGDCE